MPDIYVRNLDLETYNTLLKFKRCWGCKTWAEFVERIVDFLEKILTTNQSRGYTYPSSYPQLNTQ